MKGRQPRGNPNRRRVRLWSLAPGIGMWALREEELQPAQTVRHFLDALALRLHAVSLRVIDDAPPFRRLLVIGMGEPDVPFNHEPVHQLPCLRPPCTGDGPLVVRRRRLGGHRRCTAVGRHRVIGMAAMTEVEPASLSDLRTGSTTALVHRQKPTVTQGIRRAPLPRRPGSGFLAGRDPLKKRALSFVRRRPSFHGLQPTPNRHTPYRPERADPCRRDPLALPAASPRASSALDVSPILASLKVLELPERRLTPHQNERQMSVPSVISASRYRP